MQGCLDGVGRNDSNGSESQSVVRNTGARGEQGKPVDQQWNLKVYLGGVTTGKSDSDDFYSQSVVSTAPERDTGVGSSEQRKPCIYSCVIDH